MIFKKKREGGSFYLNIYPESRILRGTNDPVRSASSMNPLSGKQMTILFLLFCSFHNVVLEPPL